MADGFTLGPFALGEPLGRGGMGEVWSGRHVAQGVPVAVKVLTRRAAHDAHFLSIFRNEIRTIAALDHPCIVRIHAHGLIDEAAEAAGRVGALSAGTAAAAE